MATKEEKIFFETIYLRAHQVGLTAGARADVQMLTVQNDITGEVYEPFPICGFAWVNIKPGTSAFAKWLKDEYLARSDSYYGGVTIWVPHFNQSYDRKLAYARAFAKVINKHLAELRIKSAYAGGRLD